MAAVASSDLEKASGTDSGHAVAKSTASPVDEPSAEWGWHGTLPKGAMLWGLFVAIVSFCLFIGNQIGHVEDFYLALTGLGAIFFLIWGATRRRNPWKR